jgi:hypothetical protein
MPLVFRVSRDSAIVQQAHETVQVAALATSVHRTSSSRVLTVGFVVAILRAPHLVAHEHIGMPAESIVTAKKFLICRVRSFSTATSSVAPSTPQFQLRLSSVPSRLSSPFASLCLRSYDTRSFSVKPS